MPNDDSAGFVVAGFTVGLSPDLVTVKFRNKDGQEIEIGFPAGKLGNFILQLESASASLAEVAQAQLKGFDPRLFAGAEGLSVQKIDVGWNDEQVILLMKTTKGMPLSVAMDRARAHGLAQRIQRIPPAGSEDPIKPS